MSTGTEPMADGSPNTTSGYVPQLVAQGAAVLRHSAPASHLRRSRCRLPSRPGHFLIVAAAPSGASPELLWPRAPLQNGTSPRQSLQRPVNNAAAAARACGEVTG